MNLLSFADFVNESLYYNLLITEKNLTSQIDNNIKFAIVMATYKIDTDSKANTSRAKYMTSKEILTDCINSIKNQKYKNWKLFIVGDAYSDEPELKGILSDLLSSDQYTFHNLSKPGERDNTSYSSEEIRITGGIGAVNKGLNLAKNEGFKYIARIDHDDKWTPNHLELLAKAYTQFDDLSFVYTGARKKIDAGNSNQKYLQMPELTTTLDINNKLYVKGKTAQAAVSWNTDLIGNIKYRNVEQQKNTEPKRSETQPGDVDMFDRMMELIKTKKLNYMHIPKLTVYIRNRKGKF